MASLPDGTEWLSETERRVEQSAFLLMMGGVVTLSLSLSLSHAMKHSPTLYKIIFIFCWFIDIL